MSPNLLKEIGWVFFFILIFFLFKVFFFSIYLIPSSSMESTLLPGDRVISSNLSYGLKLPFVKTPVLFWSTPKRGDVILFAAPHGDETFIKRVIGLPGDTVTFQSGNVVVNGQEFQMQDMALAADVDIPNVKAYVESAPALNIPSHDVLLSSSPDKTFFESRRFTVPEKHFFVLGDNRDGSIDSRSFGYVSLSQVRGQAVRILFSTTGEGELLSLPQFRSGRFFRSLNQ